MKKFAVDRTCLRLENFDIELNVEKMEDSVLKKAIRYAYDTDASSTSNHTDKSLPHQDVNCVCFLSGL